MEAEQKAVIERINRRLAKVNQKFRTSRSQGEKSNLGSFYILDTHRNEVVQFRIEDPAKWEREELNDWLAQAA